MLGDILKRRIKYQNWISSQIFILFGIFLCVFLIFLIPKGISYLTFQEKIKIFSIQVLNRAESLLEQTESVRVAANASAGVSSWPCSYENIQHLRNVVWSSSLIQDVGYATGSRLICSAVWGHFRTPLHLNHFEHKIISNDGLWLLGVSLHNNIFADMYIYKGVVVIISPFVFKNFESDKNTKEFSAVIGAENSNQHRFKIGPDTDLLGVYSRPSLRFVSHRECSVHYNLCVTGGGYFRLDFFEYLIIEISLTVIIYLFFIIRNNNSISKRFAKSLRNSNLPLVYQPIYKIHDDHICGVEVLLRWKDKKLGHVSPDIFISLSRNNIQSDISLYVLSHSVRDFIHYAILYNIFLSININTSDLFSEKFKETLFSLIEEYDIPSGIILLEITERESEDIERMREQIRIYKRYGIKFAIDDFGAGYSNLNLVSALDVDEIKFDKSLTDAIDTESPNGDILLGLHRMFRNISNKIVFEGVETERQVNYLKKLWPECSVQGWYYSKALPLDDIIKIIIQNRK